MFLRSLNIPGSGLTAEQYRLNLVAQNITNIETTRTESGGPYRRKIPVYQEKRFESAADRPGSHLIGGTFMSYLSRAASSGTGAGGFLDFNDPSAAVVTNRAVYISASQRWQNSNSDSNFVRNKFPIDRSAPSGANGGVRIPMVAEDPTPGKMVYDPGHPDADENGYVEMPNVEMVSEMITMMSASRSYEANVQVLNAMKAMAMRALDLGR
jgi:flagellar basal-body rod protein FlgC